MSQPTIKYDSRILSPLGIFFRVLLIVVAIEFLVMGLFHFWKVESFLAIAVDCILLALLASPILYFAIVMPMQRAASAQMELRERVQRAQKLEALGSLAAGIAHDFNNILYGIRGCIERSQDHMPPDSEAANIDLERALAAVGRASDLVKEILAVGRPGSDAKTSTGLQALIKKEVQLLSAALPSTIKVVCNCDPACGPVYADPSHIREIIMNLCTNAYQAMEPGFGTLTISLTEERREITPDVASATLFPPQVPAAEPCAVLTVSDTGAGIDDASLPQIFDPYFTTRLATDGTGLGLAVVRRLVSEYGGDISVRSTPGEGSSFEVLLPLDRENQPEAEPPSGKPGGIEKEEIPTPTQTGEPESVTGRVLFVDDEELIVYAGRRSLRKGGYSVDAYQSSRLALNAFKANPQDFDVVITDETMPELTGTSLAREVFDIRQDLPVIICTGYRESVDRSAMRDCFVVNCLQKPLSRKDLLDAVADALATSRDSTG